jgi:hypothetical protein
MKLSLLALFTFSFALQAELRITNAEFGSVGNHRFGAYFEENDGIIDVTAETTFRANSGAKNFGQGYFELQPSRDGRAYDLLVEASYVKDGVTYQTNSVVRVDSTPTSLRIWGRISIPKNGVAWFRSEACFRGSRCFDVSRLGRWRAFYGRLTSWGTYYAPSLPRTDRVEFTYGLRRASRSIRIY